nr:hypothetical protein [Tanacetum cinerariifolium]
MFFYLTTLGLARFLKETVPQVEPSAKRQSSNAQAVQAVEAWKHSDFLCHNCVLNVQNRGCWYKEVCSSSFLDYKVVDSKNVISQVQDLQVLIHDIHAEGMTLSETFQAATIIEKLPPRWVEFRNYLKHKRKEMSFEELVVRLHIEDENRLAQKETYTPDSAKANMIEHVMSSLRSNPKGKGKDKRKNDKKSKGKSEYLAPKAGIVKQKFQGTCYNCDQPGHRAASCKMPKRENMVNDDVDMIAMVSDVYAMISEVNLVGTNHGGWWINTEATRHVCAGKSMFYSFRAVDNGQKLYMGNSATADIKGEGDLNVMVVKNEINKMNYSTYLIESSNVWHARLGRVNFNPLRRLIKFNSIPNCHIDSEYKCETCVEAKLTRTSFKSVKRKIKPLDMVHTDICDLKSLPTKSGNNNDKMIKFTKDMLKSKFDMKDMGLADVILGIKIIRTQNGLVLSQACYVDKILNTHNAGDSSQARTPIDT